MPWTRRHSVRPHGAASRRRAFTLIEIMVVVMIMGILLSIVLFKVTGRGQEARLTAANSQLDNLCMALEAYLMDNGNYPAQLAHLYATPDAGMNSWKGPYVQKPNFKDPWGHEFVYAAGSSAAHNKKSYDLYSKGPDGQPDTADDISNWAAAAASGKGK